MKEAQQEHKKMLLKKYGRNVLNAAVVTNGMTALMAAWERGLPFSEGHATRQMDAMCAFFATQGIDLQKILDCQNDILHFLNALQQAEDLIENIKQRT